jgi:hypothetical protein
MSLEELIASSTYIVRGRVEGVAGLESGAGGVPAAPSSGGPVLYTEYSVRVSEVLQGETAPGLLRVALPGGRTGGRQQVFSGVPVLLPGKEYVLFLWRGRSGRIQLVGMTQGLLEVRRGAGVAMAERQPGDGMLLNRKTGLPVHDLGMRVSLPGLRSRVASSTQRRGTSQ